MSDIIQIQDLKIGSILKDSRVSYKGEAITWKLVYKNHPYSTSPNVVLAPVKMLEPKKYHIGYFKDDIRKDVQSHLLKWLNSDTDFDKNFNEPGFLYGFDKRFVDYILICKQLYSNCPRKIWMPSRIEFYSQYRSSTNNKYISELKHLGYSYFWSGECNISKDDDACFVMYNSEEDVIRVDNANRLHNVVPLINISGELEVEKDGDIYKFKWNLEPSKPESFTLPEKAISRTETEISWSKSTDPENDPISYRLERSLDGGDFVERYKGSFTRFKDIIEDKGHKSVVYRVTAIDSYGNQSETLTSASLSVSDNTIPTIDTASADLGKITSVFSVDYKVVDPDEGQTWSVTESLDGKVLKTFTAKVGTSYTSKMTPSDWQKVLNGDHVLKIEVVDSDGGKSAKEITFEKDVRKLDFELGKVGLKGIDKMPERAILSMGASVPSGASIKVEITNNGLDEKPVWQDCTAQVLGNEKIFFSNKKKTATKWAVNVRVTGDKKTATDVLSVSVIGGFYD